MKRNAAVKPARILIVDDHPAVREALAMRIARHPDLEVCGEAADTSSALRLATKTQPDVAVIDITLKNGNGIDLIKRLKNRKDDVHILVWSMHSESLYARRALQAGALGYVNKDEATSTIIDAIRRVMAGKVWLSKAMTESLLQQTIGGTKVTNSHQPIKSLSDRELEVFRLIGEGVKTADIAKQLHLSVKTVETYRDRIRLKLALTNGTELVRSATEWVLEQV